MMLTIVQVKVMIKNIIGIQYSTVCPCLFFGHLEVALCKFVDFCKYFFSITLNQNLGHKAKMVNIEVFGSRNFS